MRRSCYSLYILTIFCVLLAGVPAVAAGKPAVTAHLTRLENGVAELSLQVLAPGKTIEAVRIDHMKGVSSLWRSDGKDKAAPLSVSHGGQSLSSGAQIMNLAVGGEQVSLSLSLKDNGAFAGKATDFRATVFFVGGDRALCEVDKSGPPALIAAAPAKAPAAVQDKPAPSTTGSLALASAAPPTSPAPDQSDKLWAWGNNYYGQLGDGTTKTRLRPIKIMDNVTAVNMEEENFSLAIKNDGSLWAWGRNAYGRLGDGTTEDRHAPIKIMDNVTAISAEEFHTLAIKSDGSLWAWGSNDVGRLGDGTTKGRLTPIKVMDNVTAISAEKHHSLAIKNDGSLWAWGYNENGRLGDGTTENRLTPIKIMDSVTAISAGEKHAMAIKSDGSLWAWGYNGYGLLGDGTKENRLTPTNIMDSVTAISMEENHTLAIKSDGSLWAWGRNECGRLGDGTTENRLTPIKIMDSVTAISAGAHHSLAIKNDGSLWAWGANGSGLLGDGTTETRLTPIKIMDSVTAVSAVYAHNLAIKSDDSLWAWGNNDYGQLGDGTTENRRTPIKIMDRATAISAGGAYSLAIGEGGPDKRLPGDPPPPGRLPCDGPDAPPESLANCFYIETIPGKPSPPTAFKKDRVYYFEGAATCTHYYWADEAVHREEYLKQVILDVGNGADLDDELAAAIAETFVDEFIAWQDTEPLARSERAAELIVAVEGNNKITVRLITRQGPTETLATSLVRHTVSLTPCFVVEENLNFADDHTFTLKGVANDYGFGPKEYYKAALFEDSDGGLSVAGVVVRTDRTTMRIAETFKLKLVKEMNASDGQILIKDRLKGLEEFIPEFLLK